MGLVTRLRELRNSSAGVSTLEFALFLPIFISMMGAGIEIAWIVLNTMKIQRLASSTADLIARDGASTGRLSEAQIYDLMLAMDLSAKPLAMRERGRMVITSIVGEDANADGSADRNTIKWQRFDGALLAASPILGCWTESSNTQGLGRQLRLAEPMFHVQVTYQYVPIMVPGLTKWLGVPAMITRTATYRGRGAAFQPILSVEGYPPKQDCDGVNGLD